MATVKENILNSLGWFYEDLEKYALDDINKSIEAEASARESADTSLQSSIDSEASARESADTSLQSSINTEASAREEADTSLQSDITDLQDSHVCLTDSEYSDLPDTKLTNDTFYFVSGGETTEGYDVYDTGWQMLTLGSDFEAYSSSTAPKYRRVGKIVTVMGQVTPTHDIEYSTGSIVIGTLPSDCYPVVQSLAMFQGSGTNVWCGTLQTNGSIGFSRYRNGSSTGTCSSGNWLPFIFTFITA